MANLINSARDVIYNDVEISPILTDLIDVTMSESVSFSGLCNVSLALRGGAPDEG